MSGRDPRTNAGDRSCSSTGGSPGSFLRSLLAGVPWSKSADGEELMTLARPRGAAVNVVNSNGRTLVSSEDRDDIEVRAIKHARAESDEAAHRLLGHMRVNTAENAGVLEIEVDIPRRWNRHGSVNLEVKLPRDLRLAVSAANGKVCLRGMRDRVDARSSNGSVWISDVIGDIDVITSNAKVCCEATCGRLTARSSNGKIQLSGHCGSIDASTSNGLIHAHLDELGREGVRLATSNGRIVLELPEKVDAEVDIRVENGVIRSDRTLLDQPGTSNGRMRGRLGRGGTPIKLRTSNGTISIR